MKPSRNRERGWTMVEILVVVAILAVLTGMLVPGLRNFQEGAGNARCVSNLRQIGVGMHLYVQEHGVFPYHITGSTRWSDGSEDSNSFFAGPYLKSIPRKKVGAPAGNWTTAQNGLFDCPLIQAENKTGLGPDAWTEDYFDYAQNITLCGRTPGSIQNPARTVMVVEGGHYGRIKAAHTKGVTFTPQDTSNPGGTQWNYSSGSRESPLVYQHQGKANFLFVDGHVAPHEHKELNERWFDGKE